MKRVGLHPSSVGKPGGPELGQKMSHYIVEDGLFALSFERMPEECMLPWRCVAEPGRPRGTSAKNKVKYTCVRCGANAWGRPRLAVACVSDKHVGKTVRMVP
jgi:hypothetical protein